jgi:MFS family permease
MKPQIENIETTKKILPLILATAIFMQMLDSTILNTSLPSIAKDLNESPLNMQNAIISYVLTLALFMPVSGFLADKFGTKKVFIISLILFSLGSLLCSLSPNLTFLVIARVIQGIGGSLMTPVGKLALIKTFDKSELLKAMNFAITLAITKKVKFGESEHKREPKLNRIKEIINTFFVPNLSAKKPLTGINKANVKT